MTETTILAKNLIQETGLTNLEDVLQTVSYNDFRILRRTPGIHIIEAKLVGVNDEGREVVGYDDGVYINLKGDRFGSGQQADRSVWIERLLDGRGEGYRIRFGKLVDNKGGAHEGELDDTAHIIELRGATRGQAYLVGGSLAFMQMRDATLQLPANAEVFVQSNFAKAFDRARTDLPRQIIWSRVELAKEDSLSVDPNCPKVTGKAVPITFNDGATGYSMTMEVEIPSKDELHGPAISGWTARYQTENSSLVAVCGDVAALELTLGIPTLTTQERLREAMEDNGAVQVTVRPRLS